MAGNARFESPSASSSELGFSGTCSNGQRGVHSVAVGPNLDRSGSFREGSESRMIGPGVAASRGGGGAVPAAGDLPPLSQCLSLEPIVMGDQKISSRSSELRKVMGLSVGSTTEENCFGAASHMKPTPPMAVADDLKRFRSSVLDSCNSARGRAQKIDERLHKLDKYCEAVTSKKPQRNELMANDRAGALNLKTGTQIYRNPSELVNQRVEDRPKNVLMNKRVRTSVAETRAECRSNGLRRQAVAMAKDRDLIKDNGGEPDIFEEKIRRLPAGGEGWDKKMKRKRSVGTVFARPIDNVGETKRVVQNKTVSEPGSQPNDAHPYRLGTSNGAGTNKDGKSLPNSSRARLSPKNEQEGPSLSRDLSAVSNREKVLARGNNKMNNREDSYASCPSPVTKGKASRTPRTGSTSAASSCPGTPRVSGAPETWENPTGANKIPPTGGTSNRKRGMTSGSSSPPMAQWVGQRPQKMSRTRRANPVPPVSNQDEKQLSSDSCSPSDIGVRPASDGTNGSLIPKSITNGPQQLKVKLENVQSPLKLSESEESIGGESLLKNKALGNSEVAPPDNQNVEPSLTVAVKNNPLINEGNGEGVRRQGRSGRGALIARASISPTGEKLDNGTTLKPLRSNGPSCEKNGSKLGRPLKRFSDRKGVSRLGHLQNNGSPDYTGKSDDDRDELLAAANHARNASHLACSSPFWKKMEPMFAPVSSKDRLYLSQQLKSEQVIQESIPQLPGRDNNVAVELLHEDTSVHDTYNPRERNGHVQHNGSDSFPGRLDCDKSSNKFIPLYQRVLSALIIEDNIDGPEEEVSGNTRLQGAISESTYDASHINDSEPRKRARTELECDTMFSIQIQNQHSMKPTFSCNGFTNNSRSPSINNSTHKDGHSEVELLAGISKNFVNRPQLLQPEGFGISSFDCQYEQMCLDDKLLLELQSIGLYPETVPNLDDKDDEVIKNEIDQLKIRLQQQIAKKKTYLEKISKGVGSNSGGRDLERVAMDRLVELSYRKLLSTRGPSRTGIPKVPKHVALAFGRRTLARCRKFAKSGTSCFSVPPYRDILFAPRENELEPTASIGWPVGSTMYPGYRNPHPDSRLLSGVIHGGPSNTYGTYNYLSDEAFAINGPILNRGKRKELLLDDVGTAAAKGKRSERDPKAAGRAPAPAPQGDRKTKAKPKQKAGPGNGFTRPIHPVQPSASQAADNGGNKRRDVRFANGGGPQETVEPHHELDPMEELGGSGPQDLSSLLNFDEEDLQDHYSAGLDIPMDDLTELNMF